jgi:uncharacterized membrane protein YkoI
MLRPYRLLLLALAACLCWAALVAVPQLAQAERSPARDHDRARAALLAGEILPLGIILERVQRQFPGHMLEVELEREGGRWVYEIKLLHDNGGLFRLEVDARDGSVLRHGRERR